MYRVKEVFATIQGEGANTGRVAVFVRFAGCNLWDGTEAGRARGKAPCAKWCDTDFVGGTKYTLEELTQKVIETWPGGIRGRFVVFTGGEPSLQLDEALVLAMRNANFFTAVETNGLKELPHVDWVTISPKKPKVKVHGSEIKLVYPQGLDPVLFEDIGINSFYLQPLDNEHRADNLKACIAYCMAHPHWRLSTQAHKVWGIP